MPSWWRKSNSKEVKRKGSKDNIFDALHFSKFKFLSEEKTKFKSSRRTNIPVSSDKDLPPETDSSPSPSSFVSRSQSFAERPHGKPLPLPSTLGRAESGGPPNQSSENRSGRMSPHVPPLSPGHISNRLDVGDIDGGPASRSVSSLSSEDSNGPANLHSDNSARYRKCQQSNSTIVGGNCEMHVEQPPNLSKNSEQDSSKPGSPLSNRHHASISTKRRVFNMEAPAHLHVPVNGVLASAPESSMSSPSRSPMRVYATEHSPTYATWISKQYPDAVLFSSGQCSSPGSGQNSGHNSMGGDMIGQAYLQPTKGSPEYSPIPSPRMRSGANSRVQSGAVTPLHPRAVGTCPGSPNNWLEEGKHTGHRLPLPPLSVSNQSPFTLLSTSSSTATSSMMPPRSPNRSDNPASPGSRWKKGKLLGRGTFGHVYAGLNNETGKMCAMKEVTLFSDDPKSKESVKQLAQEIAVLSRLRHNNIVQYLGSESIDDKLYIYLEYVSGGSIHKLLQEYGQFGEAVIRGYTRQILSGLAYLHSKSCVHRDIKGANILVDPSGQVKLADFGMAKHITAHSCPLSFKGSPYWMAPEVIKNANGYNLAVDIWSLGCTVLEMTTSKPPWSQYEGVAAMFKIGNSKELPAIPEYLSEEGKQFVRLCLQRDPASRPTALQLLEHPFVKNAAQYIKLDTTTNFSEGFLSSTNFDQPMIVTQVTPSRNVSVEVDNAARTRGMFTPQTSSEQFQIQKHISLPVSPSASPLIQSNYPNHRNGLRSPSPISSPLARSGASTPLTGAAGAIPFQMNGSVRQAQFVDEGFGNMPRSPNGRYGSGSGANAFYNECRTDPYSGTPKSQTPPDCPSPLHGQLTVENDILSKAFGRLARGGNFDIQKQCGGQVALAEHVSKQLLKTPSSYPAVNLRPGSPLLDRAATYENC